MNIKEKMKKMLAEARDQEKNLREAVLIGETREEREAAQAALDKIIEKITEIEGIIAELDEPAGGDGGDGGDDTRSKKFNVLDTQKSNAKRSFEAESMEYRKAFQRYIADGNKENLRAAAGNTTGADGVSTVIPENLINQIIEKLESVGTIYKLVTKTAYPVGQQIPREATKPVATWVGVNTSTPSSSTSGEGNGSSVGKTTLDTAISFTNFKLRCEVAMTEEVATMALPAFEALFVKNVSLAMLRSIEFAIVDGTGKGMPTGILAETAPTGQALEIAATDKIGYKTLCEVEAAIPAEYESGAKWCMTKKTFMSFIGMVDSNGQPIARVNYGINGKPERVLLGREVEIYVPQSGSHLANYADSVEADTLFAFIFDFSDYVLNNNYDLGIQHKIDWDNEDHRTKAVAAYDGKVIDKNSLVTLTKKAASK